MTNNRKPIILPILTILIILTTLQTPPPLNATTDNAPKVVAVMSTRDMVILLADNGCNQVYMYNTSKTFDWSSLARSGSGETVYYQPSAEEYLDLSVAINRTLSQALPGKYRDLRWFGYSVDNGRESRYTGLKIYVNPGYTDNTTVETIKEAVGPIMVEHNLTKLVIFEALSNASEKDVMNMLSAMPGPIGAYKNGEDMPGYLREAVELTLEEGYIGYETWPNTPEGYVGIGFRRPLPQPSIGDLEEIAWWLLNHTSKCGVPIVIVPKLARQEKVPIGGSDLRPINQSNMGVENQNNTKEDLGSPATNQPDNTRSSSNTVLITATIVSAVVGSLFLFLGSRMWKPYRGM